MFVDFGWMDHLLSRNMVIDGEPVFASGCDVINIDWLLLFQLVGVIRSHQPACYYVCFSC